MPIRVSIPILPGVRYTASVKSSKSALAWGMLVSVGTGLAMRWPDTAYAVPGKDTQVSWGRPAGRARVRCGDAFINFASSVLAPQAPTYAGYAATKGRSPRCRIGKGTMLASQPTGSPRNFGILMRARIAALCRRFGSDSYGRLRSRPWQMKLGGRPPVDVGVRGHPVGSAVERVNPFGSSSVCGQDLQPRSPWMEVAEGL